MKHYGEGSYKMVDKSGKEYLLTVEYDNDSCFDPRDEYNMTTMICWHRSYKLGDRHTYEDIESFLYDLCQKVLQKSQDEVESMTCKEMLKLLEESNLICIKQLNLYDHSGITISTSSAYPYNDRWDSSPVGFVYITISDFIAYGIVIDDNENWKEAAEQIIENEVQIYDYFLRGEVYSFTLEEKVHVRNETRCPHCNEVIKVDEYDDYEEVESCGGFYGCNIEDNGILDEVGSDLQFIEE